MKKDLEEALKLAIEELIRVKSICLRECGIGIVNENVLFKLKEVKNKIGE